jgi:hypothetical protein
VQYDFKNGKILIEPKDDIKARLGRSPDHADALALTFAMVDMPAADPLGLGRPIPKSRGPAGDFDPHREFNDSPVTSDPFNQRSV